MLDKDEIQQAINEGNLDADTEYQSRLCLPNTVFILLNTSKGIHVSSQVQINSAFNLQHAMTHE